MQEIIGPIGPIIGAGIAALVGILYSIYLDKQKRKKHLKIVSSALLLEIEKIRGFFELLIERTGGSNGFQDTPLYQSSILDWIINYGLAVSGPNSSLFSERSPFTLFYSDIFDLDNEDVIEDIKNFYEFALNADRYFKNFCGPNRLPNDLLNMIKQAENAISIFNYSDIEEHLKSYRDI